MAESLELIEAPEIDGDGLARGIAEAGATVSRAANDLQQAAERLMGVDALAREAETRRRAAEDQLAREAELRRAAEDHVAQETIRLRALEDRLAHESSRYGELLEVLEASRAAQADADERARRAEQHLSGAVDRGRSAEHQVQELGSRLQELDAGVQELKSMNHRLQAQNEELHARTEELLSTNDELGTRNAQLGSRNEELSSRIRELETTIRDTDSRSPVVTVIVDDERAELQEAVAADVRRPLTSILGLTLALKHADPRSAEGAGMMKQLATNARKLDRMVGQMLALDKIAAGSFEPNLRRTDLAALVARVVQESAELADRNVEIESEHIAIEVDPVLAEQIVEALLSNAGRRTAPGNPVWVKVSSGESGAVIAVDDPGPEVPSGLRGAKVASLSDQRPAARWKTTKGSTGLTLLARLAEIHGGWAWVEERSGGGASFRVFLPFERDSGGDLEGAASTRSVEDRARERVRDPGDERAVALAKALVTADDDQDEIAFDVPAVPNGHSRVHGIEDLGDHIRL